MPLPKLIILYGKFGHNHNEKQQRMIDGDTVCGYRDYAKRFGEIIYLCPQHVHHEWEHSIPNTEALTEYLGAQENAIVWSVKHDQSKDVILRSITHIPTLYYSCCAYNVCNPYVDVSLVDTPGRLNCGANCKQWFKGKDPTFWRHRGEERIYDYCLCGRRGDKHEIDFIKQLTEDCKEKRKVVWIGGIAHNKTWGKTHHDVVCTPPANPRRVRDLMCSSKVGILLTDLPAEGFPQTLIEMAMCGLPVVYNEKGPTNTLYKERGITTESVSLSDSAHVAERLLCGTPRPINNEIAENAQYELSIAKSYQHMVDLCTQ